MRNTAIETYEREGVVGPMDLMSGLLSTTTVDNIDVNPKSSTASTSLHGTAASIHQHVNKHNVGEETLSTEIKLKQLPTDYTKIVPTYLPSTVSLPNSDGPGNLPTTVEFTEVINENELWLNDCNHHSWAVFHSKRIKEGKLHCYQYGERLPSIV